MTMEWVREIDELHRFFEAWFLGAASSLDRADSVFAPGFTHIGPDGEYRDRAQIMSMLRSGRGHSDSLRSTPPDHCPVLDTADGIVATYLESHDLSEARNRRLTTVVFVPEPAAPNGLHWLHAQETWLPPVG